jgi:hypothetical protein
MFCDFRREVNAIFRRFCDAPRVRENEQPQRETAKQGNQRDVGAGRRNGPSGILRSESPRGIRWHKPCANCA